MQFNFLLGEIMPRRTHVGLILDPRKISIDVSSPPPPPPPPAWYPTLTLPCVGYPTHGCYSPELGLYVLAAYTTDSFGCVLLWSTDGINWTAGVHAGGSPFDTDYTNPFTYPPNYGRAWDVAWSPSLGLFVAVGGNSVAGSGNPYSICTSPDGQNWTRQGNPFTATSPSTDNGLSVEWSEEQALFVVGSSSNGGHDVIATSPDGTTWTTRSSPWNAAGASGSVSGGFAYSPSLDLWVACAQPGGSTNKGVATSPDGITWTEQTTPLDILGGNPLNICWSPELNLFIAVAGTLDILISSDGITWTAQTVASGFNSQAVCDHSGDIYIGGKNSDSTITIYKSSDIITWNPYPSPFDDSGGGGNAEVFDIISSPDGILAVGQDSSLNAYVAIYH
jgi:hypothetical protein